MSAFARFDHLLAKRFTPERLEELSVALSDVVSAEPTPVHTDAFEEHRRDVARQEAIVLREKIMILIHASNERQARAREKRIAAEQETMRVRGPHLPLPHPATCPCARCIPMPRSSEDHHCRNVYKGCHGAGKCACDCIGCQV